jgi:hypothetical protein
MPGSFNFDSLGNRINDIIKKKGAFKKNKKTGTF